MGTATTIEVVGKGNTYLGGCIIPGVRISMEALTSRTAQLPGIRLDRPRQVIGKTPWTACAAASCSAPPP